MNVTLKEKIASFALNLFFQAPEENKTQIKVHDTVEGKSPPADPKEEQDKSPNFTSPIKTPNNMPLARDTFSCTRPIMPVSNLRVNNLKDVHSRHGVNQVQRCASTREFRKYEEIRKHSSYYDAED